VQLDQNLLVDGAVNVQVGMLELVVVDRVTLLVGVRDAIGAGQRQKQRQHKRNTADGPPASAHPWQLRLFPTRSLPARSQQGERKLAGLQAGIRCFLPRRQGERSARGLTHLHRSSRGSKDRGAGGRGRSSAPCCCHRQKWNDTVGYSSLNGSIDTSQGKCQKKLEDNIELSVCEVLQIGRIRHKAAER